VTKLLFVLLADYNDKKNMEKPVLLFAEQNLVTSNVQSGLSPCGPQILSDSTIYRHRKKPQENIHSVTLLPSVTQFRGVYRALAAEGQACLCLME
tara:strand:- start:155 stop:439 length:285 start_codon:yes stop_codon:yes gene_type:complete